MPRTSELSKPAAMRGMPEPPEGMSPAGRRLWKAAMSARPASQWTPADLTLLALHVAAALDVDRLSAQIAKTGEVVAGKVHPLVIVRAARERVLLQTATKLRLTPSSRHTGKDAERFASHARRASAAARVLGEDDLLAGGILQ